MDKDKLNEAALRYEEDSTYGGMEALYDTKFAFKKGANWLMQQPLSDRLTDEEKERIKEYYKQAEELELYGAKEEDRKEGRAFIVVFHSIFGKELFNEK